VTVGGIGVEVLPEEVEIRLEAHAGLSAAADGAYIAALRTELTPELEREGLARELVRRTQELRKESGFNVEDRIHMEYNASERLAEAIASHRIYVAGEVLAERLDSCADPRGESVADLEFDGERVRVGLRRV
jgi:isoleucyl-tRNA synthetase